MYMYFGFFDVCLNFRNFSHAVDLRFIIIFFSDNISHCFFHRPCLEGF